MKTKFLISIILLAMGFVTNAQTSKESANARVLNEFADKLDNYNIYVHNTALEAKKAVLPKLEEAKKFYPRSPGWSRS